MSNVITAGEARELLESGRALTPAQWIALLNFIVSLGLAFLVEEKSLSGADRETIHARAEQLFADNEKSLNDHMEAYRKAQEN